MVGISIKTKTPDQCHPPVASDKRYLSSWRLVASCDAGLQTGGTGYEMRQFGAKLGKTLGVWAENGLASKCGDDKDETAMIYSDFPSSWPHSIP
jgi:hypothetical protein